MGVTGGQEEGRDQPEKLTPASPKMLTPAARGRDNHRKSRGLQGDGGLCPRYRWDCSMDVPNIRSDFEIITNLGSSAIAATFARLPEGATFTVRKGGTVMMFRITYQGGEGNDVVMARIG